MDEIRQIKQLVQEVKENSKLSNLSSSGMSVMGLILGVTGIALVVQKPELLSLVLGLLIFAIVYNIGILIYTARKHLARRRKTG